MRYGGYTVGWKQFGQRGFGAAFGPRALGQGVGAWILATHFWRDIGFWLDNDVWRD